VAQQGQEYNNSKRRHSTVVNEEQQQSPRAQQESQSSQYNNNIGSSSNSKQHKERKPPNRLALAPPVPKRTFQAKIHKQQHQQQQQQQQHEKEGVTNPQTGKTQSKSLSDADNNKVVDCSSDLCSISFDDIGDSDDLVLFDKKNQLIDPNQSSSDSNRSQTTIDTGYISAFETDRSSAPSQRQFRGRFSSEDTQSSLDSYLSSDLQRADTVDSLQSNFTDSPFVLKKNANIFNFELNRLHKKISSSGSIDSDNNNRSITPIKTHAMRRLPAVPARKGIRHHNRPNCAPPVPLRASQLLLTESGKLPLYHCRHIVCVCVLKFHRLLACVY